MKDEELWKAVLFAGCIAGATAAYSSDEGLPNPQNVSQYAKELYGPAEAMFRGIVSDD